MKIGLSFSRCIRDIVDGRVNIEDVLVVISRTDFDPRVAKQWEGIWEGYTYGNGFSAREWSGYNEQDEEKFRSVTLELYESGRLHQPRQFGAHPQRMPYYWLEASIPAIELEANPAVKRAWEQFQIVAGLSKSTKILKDEF